MHLHHLTVVIPVKNPKNLELFVEENKWLLESNRVITVDSGGGEKLKLYSWLYIAKDVNLWNARKLGYSNVKTKIAFNLDSDVIPPKEYVVEAYRMLREDKADAVSTHFDPIHTGHLEFGVSMWKTKVLRSLYDYPPKPVEKLIKVGKREWVKAFQCGFCECSYMWTKLLSCGGTLEVLPYRAKHLKL